MQKNREEISAGTVFHWCGLKQISFRTDYERNDCYDVTVMTLLSGDDVTSPLDRLIVDDVDGMFWFLTSVDDVSLFWVDESSEHLQQHILFILC